ncbi:MAG: hypothetical protein ABEJ22_06545 [Haloferacaceae archaeon]
MPECNSCGSFVTPRFARVFGDNDDVVEGCLNCLTSAEMMEGTPGDRGQFRVPDAAWRR